MGQTSGINVRSLRRINYIKRMWMLYVMMIIPMAFFVVFRYIPMTNIVIAFKDFNMFLGVWDSDWAGIKWFQQAFSSSAFHNVLRNTLMLNFLDLLFGFPAPIILAILLNELTVNWYKRFVQTMIYLPHFLSWIIITSMAIMLLAPGSGVINIMLNQLGVESIDFLMINQNWVATYVSLGVWRGMGWGTIIYLAAITGINPELYEAAEVDGAGRLRKIWNITLPGIRPTIVVLFILNMGQILTSEFDRPFTLQNPRVMQVADVISTMVYRLGIRSFQFSYTAAIGLFQSVVCVIFLFTANAMAKKVGERGIW